MSTLLFLMLLLPAPFDLIRDYTVTHTPGTDQVDITWTLMQPADNILIFRGNEPIAILPGNATSFQTTEAGFGVFQYSIGWRKWNIFFQWETDIVNLGRATWDKPQFEVEGYRIFVKADLAEFVYPIEEYYQVEGYETEEVTLKELYDAGLIESGVPLYLAIASYSGEYLSALADNIVPFTYEAVLCSIAPPQKPENLEIE